MQNEINALIEYASKHGTGICHDEAAQKLGQVFGELLLHSPVEIRDRALKTFVTALRVLVMPETRRRNPIGFIQDWEIRK